MKPRDIIKSASEFSWLIPDGEGDNTLDTVLILNFLFNVLISVCMVCLLFNLDGLFSYLQTTSTIAFLMAFTNISLFFFVKHILIRTYVNSKVTKIYVKKSLYYMEYLENIRFMKTDGKFRNK